MGFTGTLLVPAMPAYAARYEKVNGSYQMLDGTVIDGVVARGIDVSRWQGDIDWNKVAADDVEFVMLGTRSKGAVDPYFHKNVKGASDAGIRVGAYIYSLATTPQMAVEEADFVLDLVKEYPISFPIAFDAEDSATLGSLPPAQVTEIINTFCERVEAAGYYPIVYANDYWLANKIDMSNMHYDVWVARYEVKHNFSDPIMWQATSTGSIDGIGGNVDINFLYKDLVPYLPGNLWRTIGDKTYYYQNYQMQKDAWIHDGTGWFYMNGEGLTSLGWLEKQGLNYYLDESTGRMVTGWKQLGDKWYFFNGSGAMSTGWLDDNGSRYFLNEDGTMKTGWLNHLGSYYYLDETSGKMAVGWKQLGDKWYFLKDTGVMATGWLDNNGAKYFLNNDGAMVTGWQSEGDNKYFFTESGAMAVGWRQLDGTWYYFNQGGDMARGWINPDGSWYYLTQDGRMQTGWLEDGGAKYYLSTSSGKMTVGWRELDGAWYYFNGSGAMVTGLTEINGSLYYLNPADGRMAVSTLLDFDGVDYKVDENGVCTRVEEQPETAPQTDGQANPTGDGQPDSGQPAISQTGDGPSDGSQNGNTANGGATQEAPSNNSQATSPTKEIGPGIK